MPPFPWQRKGGYGKGEGLAASFKNLRTKTLITPIAIKYIGRGAHVDKEQTYTAPDFSATDIEGRMVRLSSYRGKKNVVLVFNRGFT